MPPGTPSFVAERLKQALNARGMTAITLADLLGVTRAAVSQYLSGQSTPRPEVMERICQVLNFPAPFFSRPVKDTPEPTVYFRSAAAATKLARARATERLRWLWEDVFPYLREYVQLPEINLPTIALPGDPLTISDEFIEEAAMITRHFWGLHESPIGDVTALLERNGVAIAQVDLGAADLDSSSCWSEGFPYIIIETSKTSAVRFRYDMAHELGHLLLHHDVIQQRFLDKSENRVFERQAHRFAGAFLLPAKGFTRDLYLPTINALRQLKPKWKVSIAAMIHRVEDLRLVTEEQARRLWIMRTRNGWLNREPLDDELPIERPNLQLESLELLMKSNVQAIDDVLTRLPFPPKDMEEVAMVSGDRAYYRPSIRISPELTTASLPSVTTSADENIIPFPTRRRPRP